MVKETKIPIISKGCSRFQFSYSIIQASD